jgi:hypothetical protein
LNATSSHLWEEIGRGSKEICEEKKLYPEYRISGGFSLQLYKYLSILLLRFFYFKHEFVLGF